MKKQKQTNDNSQRISLELKKGKSRISKEETEMAQNSTASADNQQPRSEFSSGAAQYSEPTNTNEVPKVPEPDLLSPNAQSITLDDNSHSYKGYKYLYLGCVAAAIFIIVILFFLFASWYRNDFEHIKEIQRSDYEYIAKTIDNSTVLKSPMMNGNKEQLEEVLEKHYSRMENLLELQYDKLQNDFNFISVWAATITIVFLVFSIYSILKTDEMLGKAENDARQMHSILIKSRANYNQSQTQYKIAQKSAEDIVAKVRKEVDELENRIIRFQSNLSRMNFFSDTPDGNDGTDHESEVKGGMQK